MNIQPRLQSFSCPACGHHIGDAASLDVVRDSLTAPALRAVFDMLAKQPGKPVMRDAIMDRIYGGRADGGPDTATSVLKVQVSQLRRKIEPFGWTIPGSRGGSGNLAQWRLIPAQAGA